MMGLTYTMKKHPMQEASSYSSFINLVSVGCLSPKPRRL
jgi:hypothetical protein